jgi:hypothetical protein
MVHPHGLASAHHVGGVMVRYSTSPGIAGITWRKRRSLTRRTRALLDERDGGEAEQQFGPRPVRATRQPSPRSLHRAARAVISSRT